MNKKEWLLIGWILSHLAVAASWSQVPASAALEVLSRPSSTEASLASLDGFFDGKPIVPAGLIGPQPERIDMSAEPVGYRDRVERITIGTRVGATVGNGLMGASIYANIPLGFGFGIEPHLGIYGEGDTKVVREGDSVSLLVYDPKMEMMRYGRIRRRRVLDGGSTMLFGPFMATYTLSVKGVLYIIAKGGFGIKRTTTGKKMYDETVVTPHDLSQYVYVPRDYDTIFNQQSTFWQVLPAYGVQVSIPIGGPLELAAEWTRFHSKSPDDLVTLGVTWRF